MARRKRKEAHIRKLGKKNGYTYFLTLPKRLIAKLSWREKQKLVVRLGSKSLVIRDWKK